MVRVSVRIRVSVRVVVRDSFLIPNLGVRFI
jgi:hypothetical protein